ncbi:hypothetical protein [Patulibacter americanus]|uniref:hypothetical protein n=1 Tax=Patulibacter americanus TaxID=588672 RepID=UPI0003B470C4|nr:hypothetical protein [Patulibacter americanus]
MSRALPLLRRLGAAAACACALSVAVAGPAAGQTSTAPAAPATAAGPGAVVDGADRTEIAQSLAEATADTGVCFGYSLRVLGAAFGTTAEQVSNGGPDAEPGAGASCPKGTVAARITLIYTSESSESEDSARISIESSVPGLPSSVVQQRLKDLELLDEGALLGDQDDVAVRNLAVALPLTLDDAVPAEESPETVTAAAAPNGDRLTGSPGDDWMRAHLVTVLVGAVLLIGALIAIVVGWFGRRATGPRRPGRSDPPSTFPSSSDSPST